MDIVDKLLWVTLYTLQFENFTIEKRARIQISYTAAKLPISAQIRICQTIAIGPVTVKVSRNT